jgi:hypothetical protein
MTSISIFKLVAAVTLHALGPYLLQPLVQVAAVQREAEAARLCCVVVRLPAAGFAEGAQAGFEFGLVRGALQMLVALHRSTPESKAQVSSS